MVTFEQFNSCVSTYKTQVDMWNEMHKRYPQPYLTILIDDEYVELLLKNQELLLEEFLGAEIFDWVSWYFYEKPKGSSIVTSDGIEYMIDTVDDFLNYMKQEYFNVKL